MFAERPVFYSNLYLNQSLDGSPGSLLSGVMPRINPGGSPSAAWWSTISKPFWSVAGSVWDIFRPGW